MKILVTSDLHFTSNPVDDYRWGIFDYIRSRSPDWLFVLGDLTDAKDRHSAKLVNRIAYEFFELTQNVVILVGNHDYVDPDHPFFEFLNYVDNVDFVTEYKQLQLDHHKFAFIPHTRDPENEWRNTMFDVHYAFIHQTVIGSEASNGYAMDSGIPKDYFAGCKAMVISGDIHVPTAMREGDLCRFALSRAAWG